MIHFLTGYEKFFSFTFIFGIDSGIDSTISSNISSEFYGFPFIHSNFIVIFSCVASYDKCLFLHINICFFVMMIIISQLTFCLCWWLTTGPISSNRTTSKKLTIHRCYGTFRFLNMKIEMRRGQKKN